MKAINLLSKEISICLMLTDRFFFYIEIFTFEHKVSTEWILLI